MHIDPETGYRYYSVSQLSRLHRILALKDFGFSLEQIATCLKETVRWVGNNGYQVGGPIRELYLQNSQPVRQDDESYITEIQVPVTKAA